jgi:hypothetical protein
MSSARSKRAVVAAVALAAALLPVVGVSGSQGATRDTCTTPVFEGGIDLVFGRATSQAAADALTQRAESVGFKGVKTVRDTCAIWKSALRGLHDFDTAVGIQDEARPVGLSPTVECVRAQEIGQLQAIFGTARTLADLEPIIDRANSFGYPGLKTKTAPCGGYQAFVAGFSSRAEADGFAQTATQRTGLHVTIIKA